MQRILDTRIERWYFKLLYAASAWVWGFPMGVLLDALHAPTFIWNVLFPALTLASVVLGARLFRGRDEPLEPGRPWWKMTARPLLSRVLGGVAVLSAFSWPISLIGATLGSERSIRALSNVTVADGVTYTALFAMLAFLYLNSAFRMRKMPPRVREPKFTRRPRLR